MVAKEQPAVECAEITAVLEKIIRSAENNLAREIESIGFRRVSDALVAELLSRCVAPRLDTDVSFHVRVSHGGDLADYSVLFSGDAVSAQPGTPGGPWARVEFDATILAGLLFARSPVTGALGWRHERLWRPPEDARPDQIPDLARAQEGAIRANNALLAACGQWQPDLNGLANRFGTDKWGVLHWYTPHYDRHFRQFATQDIRLLEIGIGGFEDPRSGGGSLRMWREYFRRGMIYGLDFYRKEIDAPRIKTIQGDQADPQFLSQMAEEIGPLDIIIDDGSHLNDNVITSFRVLFPHLRDGGVYVIEDLQTSYWRGWGGNPVDLSTPGTSIGFLKTLIDGLNHQEFSRPEPAATDHSITSLHFYHNMAFIVKGANDECGAPAGIPRDTHPAQAAGSVPKSVTVRPLRKLLANAYVFESTPGLERGEKSGR